MIKAIETHYAGYRFRSRLEARWAVFFDALGIGWEYEPQGFELPSRRYLPDFLIKYPPLWLEPTGHGTAREGYFEHRGYEFFCEIKPHGTRMESLPELRELCLYSGRSVLLLNDTPGDKHVFDYWERMVVQEHPSRHWPLKKLPAPKWTTEMMNLALWCSDRRPFFNTSEDDEPFDCDYKDAIAAARSARFEFGETPQPRNR